jgi:hypothetical protein
VNEILGTLKSELLRPLSTLILPGAVAISPYFALLRALVPGFAEVVTANRAEAILVTTAGCLFVGLILEDAGSERESAWDDAAGDELRRPWNDYLRLAFKTEPIGHKYIRSVLLRMKFELGSLMALRVAIPGVVALYFLRSGHPEWCPFSAVSVALTLTVALMVWLHYLFFRWAKDGHRILHETRVELLKGIHLVGDGGKSPADDPHP